MQRGRNTGAETNLVKEECRNRLTLSSGRLKVTCKDIIQSTAFWMRGATSVLMSQLISSNTLQKSSSIVIYSPSKISSSRMPETEISHLYHASDGGAGTVLGFIPARNVVHVAYSYGDVTNHNLKELEGSDVVHKVWEESMLTGVVNIGDKVVSYSLIEGAFSLGKALKTSFLNENDVGVVTMHIYLESSKLCPICNSAGVPENDT